MQTKGYVTRNDPRIPGTSAGIAALLMKLTEVVHNAFIG